MRCEEFKANMLDAMAGGASSELEHTKECAECAAELASYQETFALLDDWTAPEPSAYFDTRLQARLREEAAQPVGLRAKWLRMWRIPALAGALGAIAIGGVNIYKSQHAAPIAQNHYCAVDDVQALDKNYDLLKDLDSLDGDTSTDQPTDAEL